MARARLLKPGFFTNEAIVELPPFARLLFQGLWLVADREGRLEDRPKRIKMELFPADNIDVDELLSMLADAGLIQRYAVNGQGYIAIPSFLKHQNPHHREQESVIPSPETLGQAAPRQGQALGEAGTSRAVTDPVPVPDPVTDPVVVSDPVADASAQQQPQGIVEIRDLVLSKLSPRFQRDPAVWDEAEQFAADFEGRYSDVAHAIAEFRRNEQGPPFPQKLRKYMPGVEPENSWEAEKARWLSSVPP